MKKDEESKKGVPSQRKLGFRGQSLLETALVLPILLLVTVSIFEGGRIMLMFAEITSAGREAARFGAASGPTMSGEARYLDCDAIEEAANAKTVLANFPPAQIDIAYDRDNGNYGMSVFAHCGDPGQLLMISFWAIA